MRDTSRHTVRTRPLPSAALALLAFALAGCAVPPKSAVPSRAATVPVNPTYAVKTQPPKAEVNTREIASVAPATPVEPQAPLGEPLVSIAPLDAGEASAAADAAAAVQMPRKGKPLAQGKASWYGPRFHGRRTANGERYDMHALTAAHKTLPFGTRLRVRSVHTGKEVVVRINDRGPYKHQRIIDLSRAAMVALGTLERGVTEVELLRE